MSFSERLTEIRRAKGLSQEALAEKIGVSRQAVSKWETGEAQPDCSRLIALAGELNVSIDHLCGKNAEQLYTSGKTSDNWMRIVKYFLVALIAAALFLGGFSIGSGFKLRKEESKVDMPDTVTITGVSFTQRNGEFYYQFVPSVAGEKYSYRIFFRDYDGNELFCDAPFSGGSCYGKAELQSKYIECVTVMVSNGEENRAVLIASELQTDGTHIAWKPAK